MSQCSNHASRWQVNCGLTKSESCCIRARKPPSCDSSGIPLRPCDLPCCQKLFSLSELKCGLKQLWCFQKCIAMHHAESHEFSLFKTRNHAKYLLLLTPFEIGLEPHQIPKPAISVFLPQLDNRVGIVSNTLDTPASAKVGASQACPSFRPKRNPFRKCRALAIG